MLTMRYLDAVLEDGRRHEVPVRIPMRDQQEDAPATLVDPLPEWPGSWFRRSPRHQRPAVYVRVT